METIIDFPLLTQQKRREERLRNVRYVMEMNTRLEKPVALLEWRREEFERELWQAWQAKVTGQEHMLPPPPDKEWWEETYCQDYKYVPTRPAYTPMDASRVCYSPTSPEGMPNTFSFDCV